MCDEPPRPETRQRRMRDRFLSALLAEVSDPRHRRLIEAYHGDNPLAAAERELRTILGEVIANQS